LSSCEQDSGSGSHDSTWAPANLVDNALQGAPVAVPGVPVLTKQQAEHQSELMRMVAEHQQRQEEELVQIVMCLNAAVQMMMPFICSCRNKK